MYCSGPAATATPERIRDILRAVLDLALNRDDIPVCALQS